MPDGPHLVFLYGPPAVGKLTVATLLAERTGFKLLHNHVTIDPVLPFFEFGTPPFLELVGRLRRDLVQTAAREGLDLIYTFVYGPGDEGHVEDVVAPYEAGGGRVTFVRLVASRDTLRRRIGDESRRAHGKLTDVETLDGLMDRHDLFTEVPGRTSLTLDTETLTPEAAVERIIAAL